MGKVYGPFYNVISQTKCLFLKSCLFRALYIYNVPRTMINMIYIYSEVYNYRSFADEKHFLTGLQFSMKELWMPTYLYVQAVMGLIPTCRLHTPDAAYPIMINFKLEALWF